MKSWWHKGALRNAITKGLGYLNVFLGVQPAWLLIQNKDSVLVSAVNIVGTSAHPGLELTNVTHALVLNTRITGGKTNIEATTCSDLEIRDVTLTDPSGALPRGQEILINQGTRVAIRGGTFTLSGAGTPEDQINLYKSIDCTIDGVQVSGSGPSDFACQLLIDGLAGGYLTNGHGNTIKNSTVIGWNDGAAHGVGIGVAAGYGHTILGNNVSGYGNAGIYVFDAYPIMYDDFAGTLAKWTAYDSGGLTKFTISGGTALLTYSTLSGTFGGIIALVAATFSLLENHGTIEVPAGYDTTNPNYAQFRVDLDANNWFAFHLSGTTFEIQRTVAGVLSHIGTVVYNSTTHKCWRIDEHAGVVNFWVSADRLTWTLFASFADPFALTAVQMQLVGGTFGIDASPGTLTFDNFELSNMRDITVKNNVVGGANKYYFGNMLGAIVGTYPGFVNTGNT